MKTKTHKFGKIAAVVALGMMTSAAQAGFKVKISDEDTIEFGGYIKADARYVDGDVGYRDFWIGTAGVTDENNHFNMNVKESRFNTKYTHGDVMGFIEMDFYGGGGNEVISNSSNPRIRHAFIKYKNVLVGQTWSSLMNTSAIAETADFAGPAVGLAFVRQGQIRYTHGNLVMALENPESYGGDASKDSTPDLIMKYNFSGDWGNASIGGLGRSLTTADGHSESAFGGSFAAKIKTVGKDDIRIQFHKGQLGRYVSVAGSTDVVGEEVEDVTSYMAAYRHFWSDTIRSTAFYGKVETDESDRERTHWGVNLFKNFTPKLAFGVEFGNYALDEQDADSNYLQFSAKYAL